jgi:hypothetical protein
MSSLKDFLFGDARVYNADDIRQVVPGFFIGCKTNRKLVDCKKIPPGSFFFASQTKAGWKACSMEYLRGKLLLKDTWVHTHIPGTSPVSPVSPVSPASEIVVGEAAKIIEKAPPLLELEDHEKFKDADGNPLQIETRGERHDEKVYFRVSDVAKAFNMPNLASCLLHTTSDYKVKKHFTTFTLTNCQSSLGRKGLYLTYMGLLRVLFVSRSGNAERFHKWAQEILFAHQMGTTEQRQAVGSALLGMNVSEVKRFQDAACDPLSVVYLFSLGTVAQLRDKMELDASLPDKAIVLKYGKTDNLARRAQEHAREYKNVTNDVRLFNWVTVDPDLLSHAEQDLRDFFTGMGLKQRISYDSHRELVIATPQEHDYIGKYFSKIRCAYAGRMHEVAAKQSGLLMEFKHRLDMKDMELRQKDTEIAHKDTQLELERAKREFAEFKLQHC